jgi:hypothetical protein
VEFSVKIQQKYESLKTYFLEKENYINKHLLHISNMYLILSSSSPLYFGSYPNSVDTPWYTNWAIWWLQIFCYLQNITVQLMDWNSVTVLLLMNINICRCKMSSRNRHKMKSECILLNKICKEQYFFLDAWHKSTTFQKLMFWPYKWKRGRHQSCCIC